VADMRVARSRDSAYHQGTGVAVAVGPFITAYTKGAWKRRRWACDVLEMLKPLRAHLLEAGLGQISEVFDGDSPQKPGGCLRKRERSGSAARALRRFYAVRAPTKSFTDDVLRILFDQLQLPKHPYQVASALASTHGGPLRCLFVISQHALRFLRVLRRQIMRPPKFLPAGNQSSASTLNGPVAFAVETHIARNCLVGEPRDRRPHSPTTADVLNGRRFVKAVSSSRLSSYTRRAWRRPVVTCPESLSEWFVDLYLLGTRDFLVSAAQTSEGLHRCRCPQSTHQV